MKKFYLIFLSTLIFATSAIATASFERDDSSTVGANGKKTITDPKKTSVIFDALKIMTGSKKKQKIEVQTLSCHDLIDFGSGKKICQAFQLRTNDFNPEEATDEDLNGYLLDDSDVAKALIAAIEDSNQDSLSLAELSCENSESTGNVICQAIYESEGFLQ